MGQIEDLRLFVKIVDSGGIARAAEEMSIAKSAVSRRLAQLEDRYGVRLIDRQPRVWEVTSAGQELYQRASAMVADVDDLDADFLHLGHTPKGPLSISVAREFGLTFLKPTLFQFAEKHPQIDLVIDFDDRTVDLEAENYDLAIRVTATELKGLNCQRIGTTRHGLFASRSYAEAKGLPKTVDQLTDHHFYTTAGREGRLGSSKKRAESARSPFARLFDQTTALSSSMPLSATPGSSACRYLLLKNKRRRGA